MKERKTETLHITFHNHNSLEDTVKYLTKFIVDDLAGKASGGLLEIQTRREMAPEAALQKDAVL